jgi:hypothetical protein
VIEGITILNTALVEGGLNIWTFIVTEVVVLLISLLLGLAIWEGEIIPAIFTAVLSTLLASILLWVADHDVPDVTQYEVTISEEVNLIEFNEKYEIIDQRGDIYVIQERESEVE